MLRCTIVFMVALMAASCRAGFPSLKGGPETAPAVLTEAQAEAPNRSSQLQHDAMDIAAARTEAEAPLPNADPLPPRKLLAALPIPYAKSAPAGVLDRAAEASRASGRPVIIVGIGDDADAGVSAIADALARRGIAVRKEQKAAEGASSGRVDLYLGA